MWSVPGGYFCWFDSLKAILIYQKKYKLTPRFGERPPNKHQSFHHDHAITKKKHKSKPCPVASAKKSDSKAGFDQSDVSIELGEPIGEASISSNQVSTGPPAEGFPSEEALSGNRQNSGL